MVFYEIKVTVYQYKLNDAWTSKSLIYVGITVRVTNGLVCPSPKFEWQSRN